MNQRRASIYIDFDKTISPIHGFHIPPAKETIKCIQELYSKYIIIIFSCRANLEICDETDFIEMEKYLKTYNIPYDKICRDKPLYIAMIDDRAFNPTVTPWEDITKELMGKII